jgi:hypothetical protein
MDAKQQFVKYINEWINSTENIDKFELFKNNVNEIKRDTYNTSVCQTEEISISVDGINVDMVICYAFDKIREEIKPKFTIKLKDSNIYEENCCNYETLFIKNDEDATCGISFSAEELYNKIEQLKNAKYNKIKGCFYIKEKSSKNIDNILREMFNCSNKCSVCFDFVGECEKLICNHYCCRQCRHTMLKKKDRKCPICRRKNIELYKEYQDDEDDEDDDEDDEDNDEDDE